MPQNYISVYLLGGYGYKLSGGHQSLWHSASGTCEEGPLSSKGPVKKETAWVKVILPE